jgi:hypothetical protein
MRRGSCGAVIGMVTALVALADWAEPAAAQVPGLPVMPIPGDPLGGSIAPFEGATAVPLQSPG